MKSLKGDKIELELYGESHSPSIGAKLSGIPAGERVDAVLLERFMERRAPGRSSLSTSRKEADVVRFLSGLHDGVTDGEQIHMEILNGNTRSSDYDSIKDTPRPGHADFPFYAKTGKRIPAGGGYFSGRLTAPLCAAGSIALQILERRGISISARIIRIGEVEQEASEPTAEMIEAIEQARVANDSIGGAITVTASGVPAGLGDAYFGGLESALSFAAFGIPAVKAVEFGAGTKVATMFGSQNNDEFFYDGDMVRTRTNNHGGILGGISTGMPVTMTLSFKPTPSIAREQQTVNLETGKDAVIRVLGRHDPCVVVRALPVAEAITALVILDFLLGEN
ncbi:MAG: chorismate synthase [Coriobacteriia bacterium]|nr:chorismate synthase [Coriobacteriia bacterium]